MHQVMSSNISNVAKHALGLFQGTTLAPLLKIMHMPVVSVSPIVARIFTAYSKSKPTSVLDDQWQKVTLRIPVSLDSSSWDILYLAGLLCISSTTPLALDDPAS